MIKKNNRMFGWILLIILITLILLLSYFKFFSQRNSSYIDEIPVENSSSEAINIALSQIVENFNHHEKIKQYQNENIKIKAILNNRSIYISYENDTIITYEFSYNNLYLTISVDNDKENLDKFKKIYEILIYAVQERLNNTDNIADYINSYLSNTDKYEGISQEVNGNNIIYKMNITKKIGNDNKIVEKEGE